jgi:hypothetical protein
MDDLFPPIDEALIKRLDEIYPESCADPVLSDRRQTGGAHATGRLS